SYGNIHNPIDLTGQFINVPEALPEILQARKDDMNVDAIVFFMSVMYPQEDLIVVALEMAIRDCKKPIVAVWTAGPPIVLKRLRALGVPALSEPTRAIRALGGYCHFSQRRRQRLGPLLVPKETS